MNASVLLAGRAMSQQNGSQIPNSKVDGRSSIRCVALQNPACDDVSREEPGVVSGAIQPPPAFCGDLEDRFRISSY
jgi:hypothetical protein